MGMDPSRSYETTSGEFAHKATHSNTNQRRRRWRSARYPHWLSRIPTPAPLHGHSVRNGRGSAPKINRSLPNLKALKVWMTRCRCWRRHAGLLWVFARRAGRHRLGGIEGLARGHFFSLGLWC